MTFKGKVLGVAFLLVIQAVGLGQLTAQGAAPGVAQTFGAANTTTTTTLLASPGSATGAGDLLVAVIKVRATPLATVSGVTDSASNTWLKAAGVTSGAQADMEVWYAGSAASVTSVTVTVSGASALAFTVLDVTGALTVPLDQTAALAGTSTTPSTGSTGTTAQASEIAVGSVGWNGTPTPSGQTTGYTTTAIQKSTATGLATGEQASWQVLSATGTQTYGATLSASVAWTGAIATFKLGNPTLPPTITSFSPPSGTDGATVTITGTHFTGATAVAFNGTSQPTYSVDNDAQITTTVPAGATTGPIMVTTPGGTATSSTSFTVQPAISSFNPTSGVIGTSVVITGSGFTGATGVAFNGTTQLALTVNSDTQITTTVPSGTSPGTNPITVTTPGGTATSSGSFTVNGSPTPTITGFNPTSGSVGTSVVITGTGFTGANAVTFSSGKAATYTVTDDFHISTSVPAGAITGTIQVTTPGGTATSSGSFTVNTGPPTPTITSFSPTSGSVGTSVTITGTGFTNASAVKFNGTAATYTVTNDTHIGTTVPAGATSGTITVTTPGGTATSSTSFTVNPPHIMLIVMENREYGSIIGSPNAPYINSLATTYRSATKWYGVQHNSPHDYVQLLAGSDLGFPNGTPYSATTVVDELHTNGTPIPWRAYMESMPSSCFGGTTADGLYDTIHNPFRYFTKYNSTQSTGWCNSANQNTEGVLPYPGSSALVSTLNGPNAPAFVWITPNDCNNMHSDTNTGSPCASSTTNQLTKAGDTWLSSNLGPVISSQWFSQNGIIIITWDEGTSNKGCCGLTTPGGHIATIVISSNNKGLGNFTSTGDNYGTLAAIEKAYGVTLLLNSANAINGDLSGAF